LVIENQLVLKVVLVFKGDKVLKEIKVPRE
jgi:hypothetical protein